jgi:hypothetical protein
MLAHEIDVLWALTHPPSLSFCSSLSKAKPETMHEIWDNSSVDQNAQTYQTNQCDNPMTQGKKEEKREYTERKKEGALKRDPLPSMTSEPTTPL